MKQTRAVFLPALLLALALFPAAGEEAELLPAGNLRAHLAPLAGFQVQEWEGWVEGGKTTLFNIGMGIEYGVKDWINIQALWMPGVNAWSSMEDGTEYGYFNDMFIGGKAGIFGPSGLVKSNKMRLSAALGIKVPFPPKNEETQEGDHHLWGSVLRVYCDYIFTGVFSLTGYLEGVYYPRQMTNMRNFFNGAAYHPLDITVELEPRFRHKLAEQGMELRWGLPVTYMVSPWYDYDGLGFSGELGDKMKEPVHRFSVGAFFTAAFVRMAYPFDITVKYTAPVAGRNARPIHQVSLIGRVNFTIGGSRADSPQDTVDTEDTPDE
jgi:hypothetical protein